MPLGLARLGRCFLGLALLAPARALGVPNTGEVRLAAGAGYDSNPDHALDGASPGGDGVILAVGQAEGSVTTPVIPLTLSGRYDIGAKHFFTLTGDDLVSQAASGEATFALGSAALAGLSARAKDRDSRSGARDYRDLAAGLFVRARWGRLLLDLEAGAERFVFWPDDAYSYGGPQASLTATVPIDRRHSLHASFAETWQQFNAEATDASGTDLGQRRDWLSVASIGYAYRGPIRFTFDYTFTDDASNAYGMSTFRHRFAAAGAGVLPLHVVLSAQGALLLTRYPDGLAVSPQILLANDTENLDELEVKLSRAWALGPEVEVEAGTFRSDFATNGFAYHRTFVQGTFGWRF